MKYDVIGDIHGHATELGELLEKLGYRRRGEHYEPADGDRQALFLGDFIDRGPEIPETVDLVRDMVREGHARAILGNHEYNAIAFHTSDGEGGWLRSRSNPHLFQHLETLYQYRGRPQEFEEMLAWCASLPFYLDLPELRLVHAAWIEEDIDFVRSVSPSGAVLQDTEFLRRSAHKGSREHQAVEHLLKGVEIELPQGVYFEDKEGFRRTRSRIAWWLDPPREAVPTVGEVVFPASVSESDHPIGGEERALLTGYDEKKPLFLGHYWLSGTPEPITPRIACLDYSVAVGGKLVAYQYAGEDELLPEHFVSVPSRTP